MPQDGVQLQPEHRMLTREELSRLANVFVRLGVDKIRLTGGEPLVRRDAVDIVRSLHEQCTPHGLRTIAITTNGLLLQRRLPALVEAGLTAVNISLDTLRPDRFKAMTRRGGHQRVLQALQAALDAGLPQPVKLNAVVVGGVNDDEIPSLAAMARECSRNTPSPPNSATITTTCRPPPQTQATRHCTCVS